MGLRNAIKLVIIIMRYPIRNGKWCLQIELGDGQADLVPQATLLE